jgi:hypothetical protein
MSLNSANLVEKGASLDNEKCASLGNRVQQKKKKAKLNKSLNITPMSREI